jgi:membrane protein
MMKKPFNIKGVWEVLKNTFRNFGSYHLPRHSAALSYYTIFSFAPLLVVLIAVAGLFFGQELVTGRVNATLADFLGSSTARELEQVVAKASLQDKDSWAAIIGGATLLLAASSVFGQIQESLNTIWGVRAKAKKGWLRMIRKRLLSFSIIASLGFMLLVSLAVSALLDAFGNRLRTYFPEATIIFFYIINTLITLAVVTLIFAVIFRFLPDTRTRWKDVWGGAVITGIMFLLGKLGISVYLSKANVGETYGAAGAIVVLLVWVYYSALILYIGAAITRNWMEYFGSGIKPDEDAATIKVVEMETGRRYKTE